MYESEEMKNTPDARHNGGTFRVRTEQSAGAMGSVGAMTGRRGVPLSVPLPFLLTGIWAAALFGLLAPGRCHWLYKRLASRMCWPSFILSR